MAMQNRIKDDEMSNLIKQVPHQPVRPVSVERTFPDGLMIEGIQFSGDFFRTFADPDPEKLYRIVRDGDVIKIEVVDLDMTPGGLNG